MRIRRNHEARRVGAVAAALLLTGALAACGGDATVDNEGDGSPSVTASPDATETTETAERTQTPTAEPPRDGGAGGGTDAPRDGEVSEVDPDEPAGETAARTEQDDVYLAELADNDINLDETWIQDQAIAAAHEHCLAIEEGRDGFAVPLAAGQLEVLEFTDVDPDDIERIMGEAAERHYCG